MKRPRVVLKNWSIYTEKTCDQAELYGSLLDFFKRKRKFKVSPGQTFYLTGHIVHNDNKLVDRTSTRTLPIVSIKKITRRSYIKKIALFWWENDKVKRIFCAKAENGNEYYFRLRYASAATKSCFDYISLSKK